MYTKYTAKDFTKPINIEARTFIISRVHILPLVLVKINFF